MCEFVSSAKVGERRVQINVVGYDKRTALSDRRSERHLHHHVVIGVQAIVQKNVRTMAGAEELGQQNFASAQSQIMAIAKAGRDCPADSLACGQIGSAFVGKSQTT